MVATLIKLADLDRRSEDPAGALAMDADGNLFGLAGFGAETNDSRGVIYEIPKTAGGYASSAVILFDFANTNFAYGTAPYGQLVVDADGNLFGAAQVGGPDDGQGTVFELARTAGGYASTPTVLATFSSTPGQPGNLTGTLTMDAAGNLFGTTRYGGERDSGALFEIARTTTGYASTPIILTTFSAATGDLPGSDLYMDAAGNLFGTTTSGGTLTRYGTYEGAGTIYELVKTPNGYAATPTVLARFEEFYDAVGPQLGSPNGGLVADADGNLFGTVSSTPYQDLGAIFEIVRTPTGYDSTPVVLFRFSGTDGAIPTGGLTIDAQGNLFGATAYTLGTDGNSGSSGTVFKLAKTATGYAQTVVTLGTFDATNGASPIAPLLADADGNLFGATLFGGNSNSDLGGDGTVFEVTESGYVVACYCRGTRILTTCGEVPVEAIGAGDAVVTAAGVARRVCWVGRRSYAGRFLAGQRHLLPILFRAGSLGGGLPRRDLRVSPAHAMFLDGVLVPAARLVDGSGIVQDGGIREVEYFHIELDRHDVILAEGAPSESFVDDDSRGVFHNAAEWQRSNPGRVPVPAVFCAPRVDSGPVLAAIRLRLGADRQAGTRRASR